jgi:hypothetical protein
MALLVYALRRHRTDDYKAHYRIWLWAAGCWFLLSLDECGSLHESFQELAVHFTGQKIYGDGSIWWVGAYAILIGGVGVRLLFEMRGSWLSTLVLTATAVCYVTAVAVRLDFLIDPRSTWSVLVEEGCELLGNQLLLLSMTLHARHVITEMQGGKPKSSRKKVDKGEPKADGKDSAKRSDLAAPPKPGAVDQRPKTGTATTSTSSSTSEKDRHVRLDDADDRSLSRSERKLMRRQQRTDR